MLKTALHIFNLKRYRKRSEQTRYDKSTKKATVSLKDKADYFTENVSVDGNSAPKIVKDRKFIPVWCASETLGANVIWYSDDKHIPITK